MWLKLFRMKRILYVEVFDEGILKFFDFFNKFIVLWDLIYVKE